MPTSPDAPSSSSQSSSSPGDPAADTTAPSADSPEASSPGDDPARGGPRPIVGIGASSGGVQALRHFFAGLPAEGAATSDDPSSDEGMAFVVVMHLASNATSNLPHILQQETALRVAPAEDEAEVRAGTVTVIAPGQHLRISSGHLVATKGEDPHDPYTVDRFFRSLAADQGTNAVGVVLSGSGTDGTLGLRAVKEAGGVVMVQTPEDAEYPQMPESALATGVVDRSLPAGRLAEALSEYRNQAGVVQLPGSEDGLGEQDQNLLTQIFGELQRVTGIDFSGYKRSTVLRRLERRLQLTQTGTLDRYLDRLRSDTEEATALKKDLLISVTSFFRDADAFRALDERVLRALFEDKRTGDPVRVWVPGCATGEEAYSLAMLLIERAEGTGIRRSDIQVFATDVDTDALQVGRRGRYPKAIAADVSSERFERFFRPDGNYVQINHGLRDTILFAEHNLLEDPPFSDLDLVSCRNLLIYLVPERQQHVYQLLHYGLRDGGSLFLGRAEAGGPAERLFEATDSAHNILRARSLPKRGTLQAAAASLGRRRTAASPDRSRTSSPSTPPRRAFGPVALTGEQVRGRTSDPQSAQTARALHQKALMEEVASVLVTDDHEIVHISGAADRYLQFDEGVPTHDLLECVPEAIRPQLRTALYQAFDENEAAQRTGLSLSLDGEPRRLSVSIRPMERDGTRYVHVRFEDLAPPPSAEPSGEATPSEREAQLQQDLDRTQQQLEATAEEHEAVAEEMETTNEELLSMNEELQSKNEELETNKEELQSVNEELKTTNRELKSQMEELRRSKGAVENLMAATEVAILFLGQDLCLQRFSPAAATLFNLRDADIGRPLSDVTRDFGSVALVEEARRVLREENALEREVEHGADEWYLVRLRPYRTVDGDMTGVVLTLVDITERRRLERQIVDTTEQVRRQIGQDLHDILSSDLTALAIMLDNYRDDLEGAVDADLKPLEEMARRVQRAANRARTLSHALVPMDLQEEHLAAALRSLCRTQNEIADLTVTFEGDHEERLPVQRETAAHLYRIAKEAVVNARRHARADRVRVSLRRMGGSLELSVRDDGVGLPRDLDDLPDDRGLGLRTMRYRANLIGATLSLGSGSGDASGATDPPKDMPQDVPKTGDAPAPDEDGERGTLLRCTLPLDAAGAE